MPRACALGPLGSRVGLPWPLGWVLPSDTQAEEAWEAVRIDFNDGILLWSSELWATHTQDTTCARPQAKCSVRVCSLQTGAGG